MFLLLFKWFSKKIVIINYQYDVYGIYILYLFDKYNKYDFDVTFKKILNHYLCTIKHIL